MPPKAGDDHDLVFARNLAPLIKDFPTLLRRAYDNIKPGGWIETQDFSANVDCDDGTMPVDHPLAVFWDKFEQAMRLFGPELRIAPRIGQLMEEAGFVNVQKKVFKVPVGTWPLDRTLRLVGLYMKTVTADLLGAVGAKPLQAMGMSDAEIQVFLATVRKALEDEKVHAYGRFYVWSGQKPGGEGKGKTVPKIETARTEVGEPSTEKSGTEKAETKEVGAEKTGPETTGAGSSAAGKTATGKTATEKPENTLA